MPTLAIRLNQADNVVVARADILPGTAIPGEGVKSAAHIPAGHKVATFAIATGAAVPKYNQNIGFATSDIAAGDHVHTHNVAMGDFARDYAFAADYKPTDYVFYERSGAHRDLLSFPARRSTGLPPR